MNVFIEKGITEIDRNSFSQFFGSVGIKTKFYGIVFNIKQTTLSCLEFALQKEVKGQNLVITKRRIDGRRQLGLNFYYHGIVSELNGNVGIVTFNEQTKERINLVSLHEALHLLGLKHCNSHGCLMAFKLCNIQLYYCLNCSRPCYPIHLCEECKGELNGTKT